MALHFTGTWEQALLTATAQSASEQAKGYLGRTALQKIIYFLQVTGVPMRYRFDIYHYGPYCDRITRDVDLLLADDVLKDTSSKPDKYSNYRLSASTEELLRAHSDKIAECRPIIEAIVKSLLPLEPEHLELLATLDYLYRQARAGGGSGPWKKRVIDRFIEVKGEKFDKNRVSQAYDSLVSAGVFDFA